MASSKQIIISHRGNLTGPNTATHGENHPQSIINALLKDFGCEIDIRWVEDKQKFYLGHDEPQYEVDIDMFAFMCSANIFVHCKDVITMLKLMNSKHIQCFFHQNDDVALVVGTSQYLWSYPRKDVVLTEKSIAVLPELVSEWKDVNACAGVCTDFPMRYKNHGSK